MRLTALMTRSRSPRSAARCQTYSPGGMCVKTIGLYVSFHGSLFCIVSSDRIIVLIITMLIVIPILIPSEDDTTNDFYSNSLHRMAILNFTNTAAYSV